MKDKPTNKPVLKVKKIKEGPRKGLYEDENGLIYLTDPDKPESKKNADLHNT